MADLGLVLDMAGVVVLGWLVPAGSALVLRNEGSQQEPVTWWAKVAKHVGWGLLLVGFGLQLLA